MKIKFFLNINRGEPLHETEMESPPHVGDLVAIDSLSARYGRRQVTEVLYKLHDPLLGEDRVSPQYVCVEVVLA
jgi:hypothetical protein